MSLPLPTLYVDIVTGDLLLGLGGVPAAPLVFTYGDIVKLPIGFCDGSTDKSDLVTGTGTATITTAIKAFPGTTLLASGSSYTYATPIASLALSLNTDELGDYFDASVPSASSQFFLEIKVVLSGEQRAYYLAPVTIRRSVSDDDDPDPTPSGGGTYALRTQAVMTRADVTTLATLKALATASTSAMPLPTGILFSYFDAAANVPASGDTTGAVVTFYVKAGTAAASSPWVLRPDDYNGSTNAKNLVLVSVLKAGAPCLWNSTTQKFHPTGALGTAGTVEISIDQTGFVLS
jgi:hypothetical protein